MTDSDWLSPDALFPATRDDALARLGRFVPRAGRRYAATRNLDPGPERRDNVSMLSPYIRHRLVTEQEVCAKVLAEHSYAKAEKFVQEVLWRTYWKGWLELRPGVWQAFVAERDEQRERAEASSGLRHALTKAEAGRTGIDCFDDWARELIGTGYLHNHVRMWFASIWIFTLKLPWALGADFFLHHLLDADPASNTLGWRWVAGLQTRGKTYLARPDNIEKFTGGRYRPDGLATEAPALEGPELPAAEALVEAASGADCAGKSVVLLVHPEDLHPESLLPDAVAVESVVTVNRVTAPTDWPFGEKAQRFVDGAMSDARQRAESHFRVPVAEAPALTARALIDRARSSGVDTVLTPYAPVGPMADALALLDEELADAGLALIRLRRRWDELAWPNATRGFFPFKKKIPALLDQTGVIDQD
jgi:hypothetical protein